MESNPYSNIIRIPVNNENIYKYWLLFLKPYHNLTNTELEVAAAFLKKRMELFEKIQDEDIVDQLLFSLKTRKDILENLKMKKSHFYVILTKLKKNKIIIDKSFNKKLIPNIHKGTIKLLLSFSNEDYEEK